MSQEIIIDLPGLLKPLVLDEQCWRCAVHRTADPKCEICNGIGFVLTDAGDALVQFCRRHLILGNMGAD
jgi:hypothetical protein